MIDRKFRKARIWSNKDLMKYAKIFTGKIVNVSAWKDYDKCGKYYREYFKNADEYFITNYGDGYRGSSGEKNEIVLNLEEELPENFVHKFNVVFNHTTLEHIFNIDIAFKNLCLMASDAVIIVVPFSQVQHISESYNDYWRFTPYSIQKFFEKNGYTMVVCDYNHDYNAAIYLLCIGLNNENLEKYIDKFEKYDITKEENIPGTEIGTTAKEYVKRLFKRK